MAVRTDRLGSVSPTVRSASEPEQADLVSSWPAGRRVVKEDVLQIAQPPVVDEQDDLTGSLRAGRLDPALDRCEPR